MKHIEYYCTPSGVEPCRDWLMDLDTTSQLRVSGYIRRIAAGAGKKNVKPVGGGVYEVKIDYGPGFRVYFGEVKNALIVLLVGGDKSTQFRDIRQAQEYWRAYVSK